MSQQVPPDVLMRTVFNMSECEEIGGNLTMYVMTKNGIRKHLYEKIIGRSIFENRLNEKQKLNMCHASFKGLNDGTYSYLTEKNAYTKAETDDLYVKNRDGKNLEFTYWTGGDGKVYLELWDNGVCKGTFAST